MSERWIRNSEKILEQIKGSDEDQDRDRLELVREIRFNLGAFQRSLLGWMQWVNNPEIMTKFSQRELEEMNKTLGGFVRSFIEYDIKITNQGIKKGLIVKRKPRKPERQLTETFYV